EAQQFGIFSWGTFPGVPEYRKKPGSSWSWNLVNVISPTVTNEFVFGYNHLTQVVDLSAAQQTTDKTALGFTYQDLFPSANLRNLVPGIVADYGDLVHQSFPPGWTSEARAFTWTDNVTKITGPHTLKTGLFFDYNQAGQQPAWQETPVFNFVDGGSSFLKNTNNGIANLVLGNYYSVFPGVVNFGNPYNGMVQEGNGIPPGFVDHKYGNIEPRLGFAYDPRGNGKMAIRGGFGIFHERIRQNVNSFDGLGNPPLAYQP